MSKMNLPVKQAADLVGLSRSTVHNLIAKGHLTDQKPRVEGAKKHYASVNVAQLREVIKTLGLKKGRNYVKPADTDKAMGVLPTATFPTPAPIPQGPAILQRIEAKLDLLIKLWS